jgi:hypothetical protein
MLGNNMSFLDDLIDLVNMFYVPPGRKALCFISGLPRMSPGILITLPFFSGTTSHSKRQVWRLVETGAFSRIRGNTAREALQNMIVFHFNSLDLKVL